MLDVAAGRSTDPPVPNVGSSVPAVGVVRSSNASTRRRNGRSGRLRRFRREDGERNHVGYAIGWSPSLKRSAIQWRRRLAAQDRAPGECSGRWGRFAASPSRPASLLTNDRLCSNTTTYGFAAGAVLGSAVPSSVTRAATSAQNFCQSARSESSSLTHAASRTHVKSASFCQRSNVFRNCGRASGFSASLTRLAMSAVSQSNRPCRRRRTRWVPSSLSASAPKPQPACVAAHAAL